MTKIIAIVSFDLSPGSGNPDGENCGDRLGPVIDLAGDVS